MQVYGIGSVRFNVIIGLASGLATSAQRKKVQWRSLSRGKLQVIDGVGSKWANFAILLITGTQYFSFMLIWYV